MSGFSDIPVRENGKDFFITATWFNTIRTKLIEAFGSGGYIKVQADQFVTSLGEITVDPTGFKPLIPISGSGGAVITSSTPFGVTHGFASGKEIVLLGLSDTDLVTLEVNDIDEGIISNGKIVLSKYKQVTLIYNSNLKRFIRGN